MTDHEPNNSHHPVTKAEVQELLSATTDEFKKLFEARPCLGEKFATKEETEQLFAANQE
jgi:hypothetical protein